VKRARLWAAAALLLAADLLIGCATRIESRPPTVTVVWGNARICSDHEQDCVEGGTVSDTFAKWTTPLVKALAGLVPGDAPAPDVTVNAGCEAK
jgi:hypothetical protein